MSCHEFLNHMETIFGEPVLPSLYVSFSYVQQKFLPTTRSATSMLVTDVGDEIC